MSRPYHLTDVHGRPIVERPPVLTIDQGRAAAMAHLARQLDVSVDRVRLAIEHLEARGLVEFKGRERP